MIVLDTHIWLWWMNNDQLSLVAARRKQIEEAEVIAVSAISCFEVAWLEQHQRISLPCPTVEWLEKSLHQSGIVLLPVTPAIAVRAVKLHEHHSDPQDRIIIASALENNAKLMSDDRKFIKYSELDGSLL
jgi:PIN domain nuclease of toxin-antitoxin system